MCGIVGYIGDRQAAPILLEGLEKLEYRGYDSAGISVCCSNTNRLEAVKTKGGLKFLWEKTDGGSALPGNSGIGHTRWATHGEPSELNAHPHISDDHKIMMVHNGIIENYLEIKEELLREGYGFQTQTDTEVACKLLHYYYKETQGDPLEALSMTMVDLQGSFAFGILFEDHPDKIFAARKDSPLILGQNEGGSFMASDVPAILQYCNTVYYMEDMEIAVLQQGDIRFYNIWLEELKKEPTEIKWHMQAAEKNGFEHYMMKEIQEQPKAVEDTLHAYVGKEKWNLGDVGLTDEKLAFVKRIYMVACGSAYHAALTGKYVIETLAKVPVEIDLASEFRYREVLLEEEGLVVLISQSGETADTLAALRLAKERGMKTLGIVNVVDSAIAREADYCMYTYAGPEIAVATTKAYSAQLINLYLLGIRFGMVKGHLTEERCEKLLQELEALPAKIQRILEDKERMQWVAGKLMQAKVVFFMGRGMDYTVGLEGSLKLKEISYMHSEGYAAGELKHGTISLIEKGTPVIGILTGKDLYEKSLSNMMEVKSRGAYLIGITTYGNYGVEDTVDVAVYIPKTDPCFAPSLAVVPLQLLAYYVSRAKGLDVDKPRNLAKSVTVE